MVKLEGIYRGEKRIGYEVLLRDGSIPIISSNGNKEKLFETLSPELDLTLFLHHANWARENKGPSDYIFINIKPQTIVMYWDEVLNAVNGRIVIELREDWISEKDMERLVELRKEHMFLLSLDDFGRQSSNVERVVTLSPNFIKVDISLFNSTLALFKLTDFLRSVQGCHIIAEKVEDERHFRMIKGAGIEMWQGYYEKQVEDNRCSAQDLRTS